MTIDEAIEIIEKWKAGNYATRIEDMTPAVKLLVEAGKWVKRYRPDNKTDRWSLLPGETEE